MITKPPAPPGTTLVPTSYSFLKPACLRIRNAEGIMSLVGFGIGDKIQILEPSVQLLVCSGEVYDEIPLADGSFITHWPDDLSITKG